MILVAWAGVAAGASPWITLFDGRSTAAWREVTGKVFPATWTIEDASLRALNLPGGLQDICTVEEFTNFELTLEWKLEADGNSGIKYLVQKRDEWTNANGRQARARGPEFQLAGPQEPDGRSDPMRAPGSLYSVIPPTAVAGPARLDGFNELRLVVHGMAIEHWLNGVRVLAYDLQAPVVQAMLQQHAGAGQKVKLRSPVCLQNHGSPAWFRNVRIRRLE